MKRRSAASSSLAGSVYRRPDAHEFNGLFLNLSTIWRDAVFAGKCMETEGSLEEVAACLRTIDLMSAAAHERLRQLQRPEAE